MVNKAKNKPKLLILSLIAILLVGGIGAVLAFIFTSTPSIENVFTPSKVTIEIEEEFDGDVKENIAVTNKGDTEIYVRVKLISYRVKDDKRIGGKADIPNFTPQNGWFEKDGYYYYPLPLSPDGEAKVLIKELVLKDYTGVDADGGKQVIEVHGEGIQSLPTSVVEGKWNVTVDSDGNLVGN